MLMHITQKCECDVVDYDAKQIASDWITYAKLGPDLATDAVFCDGWVLVELAHDKPLVAWEAIKIAISRYPENEFYSFGKTEAQTVIGLLAAGPLEDLLQHHGPQFIEAAEAEARQDRRMGWALGGVWQNKMSDDIWARVQKAADQTYWVRPSAR